MQQPNIVFIMTDQMRGDCLGIAGHKDVKTPYLDSLISNGVYFPNAYSSCPSCIAARAAIHTGLSQKNHGRVGYMDGLPWNYEHTLAGEISKAGYYTQCVGKMHVHPLRNLLGFNNIELHDGYLHYYRRPDTKSSENQKIADDYFYYLKQQKGIQYDVTDTGIDCNSYISRPWMYEEELHPTNWVTTRSIDFLRRRDPRKPFFLMSSYLRPHPPFDAPQYYFDMYSNIELEEPCIGDWEDTQRLQQFGRIFNSNTGPIDKELIRQAQIGYYACITHLDHQIGRLIQALIEEQLYDNTIIIFTSDHGEELCDHHTFRKSLPTQGSIHIPFFISGGESALKNIGLTASVKNNLFELRDIMPTILNMINQDIPKDIDGIDITKQDREYIHGEHSYGDLSNHFIVTKNDKFIWYSQSGKEQYFVLKDDPKEKHDKINDPQYAQRIEYLKNLLIYELNDREEGYTDGEKLIVGITPKHSLNNSKL